MKKKIIIATLILLLVVIVVWATKARNKSKIPVVFETEKVILGNISEVITATGALEALETVAVGTQVSGDIENIYVDFNSQVTKGQLLAQLDETPLLATLEQSKAAMDNAEAELDYQKATFERTQTLFEKKLIAQADYDLALYNYRKAQASLKNAKSQYSKNEINLSYARIYSPIDGIILDRAVDEGQTVAASFNTPTLFTIVNDLTQMQVEANIDEADIGKVKEGQRVEFTVDAYPDLTFDGKVTQIRLQPVESSNVVTYTVIVDAPNPDKKLMPGMTANVTFYVMEKEQILVVPAKAVHLQATPEKIKYLLESYPDLSITHPEPPKMNGDMPAGSKFKRSNRKNDTPMPPRERMQPELPDGLKIIWVKKGQVLSAQRVKVGDTDEVSYEVISGLCEGDEVVSSLEISETKSATKKVKSETRSPFMPSPPGGGKRH